MFAKFAIVSMILAGWICGCHISISTDDAWCAINVTEDDGDAVAFQQLRHGSRARAAAKFAETLHPPRRDLKERVAPQPLVSVAGGVCSYAWPCMTSSRNS